MPLQLDHIFSLGAPSKESFINRMFSNPYYTAAAITIIAVLVLAIFFPLANQRGYFKLFIHLGLLNTLIMILHDSLIGKSIEQAYERDDAEIGLSNAVNVSPLGAVGGGDDGVGEPNQEALDEIISELEKES